LITNVKNKRMKKFKPLKPEESPSKKKLSEQIPAFQAINYENYKVSDDKDLTKGQNNGNLMVNFSSHKENNEIVGKKRWKTRSLN
jgi:hypothetical protein